MEISIKDAITIYNYTSDLSTYLDDDLPVLDIFDKIMEPLRVSEEEIIRSITNEVNIALFTHNADNVDVVRNEETNMIDIIYHSSCNSFAIKADVMPFDVVDTDLLIKKLDKLHVGHCW